MAAQFTEMKGSFDRLLFVWINRASTSLPVPDSPVTKTLASDGAICAANFSVPAIKGSLKITDVCSSDTACRIAAIISGFGGKGIYSFAPAFIAATAASGSLLTPHATTGVFKRSPFMLFISFAIGNLISIITRSAPRPSRIECKPASILST